MTKHVDRQKAAIETFLKREGKQTPKDIANYVCGENGRSNRIYKAINALLAEGKLIKHDKTGVQNEPVRYEWNTKPVSKFNVASVWRTRGGEKAVISERKWLDNMIAIVGGKDYWYHKDGTAGGSGFEEYDLIAPWEEPASEAPAQSELREVYQSWLYNEAQAADMFEAIITEIERLSAKVEELSASTKPADAEQLSAKPEEEQIAGWANIYCNAKDRYTIVPHETRGDADLYANNNIRIACVPIRYRKGEGL